MPDSIALVLALFALLCAVGTAPMAVLSIRHEREARKRAARRAELQQIADVALETGQIAVQTAVIAPFIAESVSTSTFGDRRRRTGHVAEFMKVETGPIPLPDEHVPA